MCSRKMHKLRLLYNFQCTPLIWISLVLFSTFHSTISLVSVRISHFTCRFKSNNSGICDNIHHLRIRKDTTTWLSYREIHDGVHQMPLPIMPSQTFFDLVYSQFELLANALVRPSAAANEKNEDNNESKIKSIALYLPQENSKTGHLEFLPTAIYPSHPKSERVFIASDAKSGLPPTVPPTLTQLPGFAHAETIIPTYPFTSGSTATGGSSAGVGTPEEVFCDLRKSDDAAITALSLPLFSGPHTIGVLVLWGQCKLEEKHSSEQDEFKGVWTEQDMSQIKRTAESIAMALCMDTDRIQYKIRTDEFRVAIADNLHQVKNPIQALRTFAKLLKRNMATDNLSTAELGQLVNDIYIQSDRIAQNLVPIDNVMDIMEDPQLLSYQDLLHVDSSEQLWNSFQLERSERYREENSKMMPTSSYLVKLSQNKQQALSTQQERDLHIDEEPIQIAFLTDLLQPVISASVVIAKDNDIALETNGIQENSELPGVMIYPRALQESLSNVVDNAIKYVNLGSNGHWGVVNQNPLIRISLQPNAESLATGVTVIIEDNGPGISIAERDSVFQRGYRGIEAKARANGSGIGLDYSKLLVEKMGGSLSIHVNSDSDLYLKGTVVKCTLYRKASMADKKGKC